jgi:hypothetical protein
LKIRQRPVKGSVVRLFAEELVDVRDEDPFVPVISDVAAVVDDREQVPKRIPWNFLVFFQIIR